MKTWQHEINDVLIIEHKGVEQVARLVRYEDSLDDIKPVYVNLRVSGGQRWGEREVKIQPAQVKGMDKDWYQHRHEAFEASIRKTAEESWARMTPSQRERVTKETRRLRSRTPIEAAIDRACGLE